MGIFGRKTGASEPQAPPPNERGTFTRLDGTTVQLTLAEFNADEGLQREVFTRRMLEFVDEGLPLIAGGPDLRLALMTAIWNLTWEAQRTADQSLTVLIARVSGAYASLAGMSMEDLGNSQLENAELVLATRQRFLGNGQGNLERDLSLLATTQLRVQEARPDFEAVMAAITAAATRRVNP